MDNNDKNLAIDTNAADAQELTLVDIEELRAALGAQAQAAPTDCTETGTCMCPQWA